MKKIILTVFAVILTGGSLFIWLGVYNIAAADKHWALTNQLLVLLRDRSIQTRSNDILVPNLDGSALISASVAENYQEMCSVCHLAPGLSPTELYNGLYPQPPVFYEIENDYQKAAAKFWVIKNGIKLTGMPAWGGSHSDEEIWGLVAFISKLNEMSADDYQNLTVNENRLKNENH